MKQLFNHALKILVLTCIISLTAILLGCNSEQHSDFAIILADTGEVLLNEDDIAYFIDEDTVFSGSSAFELNRRGMEKWNSHLTYQGIPKLNETLFSREFFIEIDGKEICRGKFWSGVSSSIYSGVIIFDSLFKLDGDEYKTIWLRSDNPGDGLLESSIRSELVRFFEEHNLLK